MEWVRVLVGGLVGILISVECTLGQDEACAVIAPSDLIVNEIMYDRSEPDFEYVEVFNRSECHIDLSAVALSDSRMTREPILGQPALLAPGGFAVLVSDPAAFLSVFGDIPHLTVSRWPALNNGGDAVVLTAGGILVDSMTYTGSWGISGRSLERKGPDLPSTSPASWAPTTADLGGTPGEQNSQFVDDLDPPEIVSVEQDDRNTLLVIANEDVSAASVRLRWGDHVCTTLEPTPQPLRYRCRFDQEGATDYLVVDQLEDLSGNVASGGTVTIGMLPRPGEILFTEIMFDPHAPIPGELGYPEYLELVNTSARTLSLREAKLAESADGVGAREGPIITDRYIPINPGDYLVIHDGSTLHLGPGPPPEFARYGSDAGAAAHWIAVNAVTLRGLANSGQEIALLARDGTVIDTVVYSPTWHSLTLRELGSTRGRSLERRTLISLQNVSGAWTSSVAPSGGTPGRSNSVDFGANDTGSGAAASVTVRPTPFSPDGDGYQDAAELRYQLRGEAGIVRVRIFDVAGRVVRVLSEGQFSGATGTLVWDGSDDSGMPLQTGPYIVVVEGMDATSGRIERHRGLVTLIRRR